MLGYIVLATCLLLTKSNEIRQTFTSNQGLNFYNEIYEGSYAATNLNYDNQILIDSIILPNANLDISTKLDFKNYQVRGTLLIENVRLITNLKAIYLNPNLYKNFTSISLTDTLIGENLIIRNTEISNQLNNNIVNLETSLLTSIHLNHVTVENNLIIGSNNILSNTILIENSIIKGNLVIDGNKLFTGTIIIKDSVINGFIRIERVTVSSRINLDQNVTTSNPITICPNPFFTNYKGESFNGCYYYSNIANNWDQAVSKCNAIGGNLITIKNRKIIEDLPKLYSSFSEYYYWIGAYFVDNAWKWQDGSLVNGSFWCSSYPSGSNRCTYYTTQPVFGKDKCFKNGPCGSNWFDHALVCQYLHPNANYNYY